jgi:hypothetical protein
MGGDLVFGGPIEDYNDALNNQGCVTTLPPSLVRIFWQFDQLFRHKLQPIIFNFHFISNLLVSTRALNPWLSWAQWFLKPLLLGWRFHNCSLIGWKEGISILMRGGYLLSISSTKASIVARASNTVSALYISHLQHLWLCESQTSLPLLLYKN